MNSSLGEAQWHALKLKQNFMEAILLPLIFFSLSLLEQSLLEREHDAGHSIVSGFRIAHHEVPSREQLPRKKALVLLLGEFAQSRILCHSENVSYIATNPRGIFIQRCNVRDYLLAQYRDEAVDVDDHVRHEVGQRKPVTGLGIVVGVPAVEERGILQHPFEFP